MCCSDFNISHGGRNDVKTHVNGKKHRELAAAADESLSIGIDTWVCVAELEKEMDMKPFFSAVKQFYLATLKKMFKKFPFEDTLLQDLGIIRPNKTASYTVNTVHRLAKRFPQIELASSCSLDCLAEEFTDFVLSPSDLPPLMYYKDCDGTDKPRPGPFWCEVGKMKTLLGESRFPKLAKLMAGLLSIPCSNADSERGFSILRKIHTDQRSNLDQSTLISLMSIKYNCDDCCHEAKLCLLTVKKLHIKSSPPNKYYLKLELKEMWSIDNGHGFKCGLLKWVWFWVWRTKMGVVLGVAH